MGRKATLEDLEPLLVEYLNEMDRRYYGFRISDAKRMGFQLCEKNNLPNLFNRGKKGGRPYSIHADSSRSFLLDEITVNLAEICKV